MLLEIADYFEGAIEPTPCTKWHTRQKDCSMDLGNRQPWCEILCHNTEFRMFDRIGRGKYRVRTNLYWCNKSAAG